MIRKLQAFRAWDCEGPTHMIIVAGYNYKEARETAAKFLRCPVWDIRGCSTAQRHIRKMRAPGVAWVVNTTPEHPRRYPAIIPTLEASEIIHGGTKEQGGSRAGVERLLRLVSILGVIDSL